jgi:hypothetical protein
MDASYSEFYSSIANREQCELIKWSDEEKMEMTFRPKLGTWAASVTHLKLTIMRAGLSWQFSLFRNLIYSMQSDSRRKTGQRKF